GQLLPGNNFTTECNIPGNFMCGDGKCVPGGWQCDGLPDCFDKSDEKGCRKFRFISTIKSRFRLSSSHLALPLQRGRHQLCIIAAPFESAVTQNAENLRGVVIALSKVKSKCAPTFFACANGVHCIVGRFRCNGFSDCPDGSDEENCSNLSLVSSNPLVCSEARFKCRNGHCVDRSFLCNGEDNCLDNSDEELCQTTAGRT
ncbi:unnamed protein product, partial [Menidia menidia]